jgi:5-hydroxyisourate hydrolase
MAGTLKRISTHVLDTALGKPAAGVPVRLELKNGSGEWEQILACRTNDDGRCEQLLIEGREFGAGEYRITFLTRAYFKLQDVGGLYPQVEITFSVGEAEAHYHIPLLLSPNGYTTYRGS